MSDKRKVLIVDDMEQNRNAVKAFLFFSHFDASLCKDGLEAKALLAKESFDLVVSDIEMPNMNGFELLGWIRRGSPHASKPVIMLSSLESDEVVQRCKRLGANAYIVKPFTKDKLQAALKTCGLLPSAV